MNSNTLHTGLLTIIAIALIAGMFQTQRLAVDLDMSQQNNNTISVTGKAEKKVAPDTARISFYVTKRGLDQKEVADFVNRKTKNIIEEISKEGIEKKDIRTTNYSLNPEYSWDNGERRFKGYRAQQNITVTVRDITKAPEILARIAELRVDNINGPNLYIDKLDDIKDDLRAEAIADAKSKANELAKELGVRVNKIVGFSEDGNDGIYYPVMTKRSFGVEVMADNIETPEITKGEETITKTVTITFKIEN